MRQAGRYMPEYRSLRKSHTILELCKNPELAAQVTLQPIEALDVDAAIIFADLLLPVEPMGMKLEFLAGEGPALTPPVRSLSQIEALNTQNGADLGYVPEAISLVKRELDGKVPLIGFVGAPFTLASYMIEGSGSRHYLQTKRLMYGEPAAWNALMTKIVDVLGPYAAAQVKAGADAIQVFDSWVGALSPGDYETYVLPHSKRLIETIQRTEVPVIHFGRARGRISICSTKPAAMCWDSIGVFDLTKRGLRSITNRPCRGTSTRWCCSPRLRRFVDRSRTFYAARPADRDTFSIWATASCPKPRWTT